SEPAAHGIAPGCRSRGQAGRARRRACRRRSRVREEPPVRPLRDDYLSTERRRWRARQRRGIARCLRLFHTTWSRAALRTTDRALATDVERFFPQMEAERPSTEDREIFDAPFHADMLAARGHS